MWSLSPFGDIVCSHENRTFVYSHTHFALDNKRDGVSFNSLIHNPSVKSAYFNVFTLYPDGDYKRVVHAMQAHDQRILVAGHTLWSVVEQDPYYVNRPGTKEGENAILVTPRLYYFLENNGRLKCCANHRIGEGCLCHTQTSIWNMGVETSSK